MGTPTDFAAFAQGNQDGSGAPGFGPAGSPADSQDRSRRRTRPGDDEGYIRVPAYSPRPSPYGESSASAPNMEQMFQKFYNSWSRQLVGKRLAREPGERP